MLPTACIINSIILLSHHISMQCSATAERILIQCNSIWSFQSVAQLSRDATPHCIALQSFNCTAAAQKTHLSDAALLDALPHCYCAVLQARALPTIARSVWGLSNVWEMIFRSVRNRNRAQSCLGRLEASVETPPHSSLHFFSILVLPLSSGDTTT